MAEKPNLLDYLASLKLSSKENQGTKKEEKRSRPAKAQLNESKGRSGKSTATGQSRYGVLSLKKVLTPLGLQSQQTRPTRPYHSLEGSEEQISPEGLRVSPQQKLGRPEEPSVSTPPSLKQLGPARDTFATPPFSRLPGHRSRAGLLSGHSPALASRQESPSSTGTKRTCSPKTPNQPAHSSNETPIPPSPSDDSMGSPGGGPQLLQGTTASPQDTSMAGTPPITPACRSTGSGAPEVSDSSPMEVSPVLGPLPMNPPARRGKSWLGPSRRRQQHSQSPGADHMQTSPVLPDASQAGGLQNATPARPGHSPPAEPSPPKRRQDAATHSRKKSALDVSQGTKDFLAQVNLPNAQPLWSPASNSSSPCFPWSRQNNPRQPAATLRSSSAVAGDPSGGKPRSTPEPADGDMRGAQGDSGARNADEARSTWMAQQRSLNSHCMPARGGCAGGPVGGTTRGPPSGGPEASNGRTSLAAFKARWAERMGQPPILAPAEALATTREAAGPRAAGSGAEPASRGQGGSRGVSNGFWGAPGSKAALRQTSWVVGQNTDQAPARSVACPVSSAEDAEKVYKPFAKQHDAIAYAAACNEAAAQCTASEEDSSTSTDIVKCWCEEQQGKSKGQPVYYRSFLAASYSAFWQRYTMLAAHARHCYEVIQQDKPCHMYFDLEFSRPCNPNLDGDSLVETLIQLVRDGLRRCWEEVDLEGFSVVDLGSSTPDKFSRHLVVKLAGMAFESNSVVGSFVSRILARPEAGKLTVRKSLPGDEVEEFTSFVDTAVYTKNRHFRVLWSSKGGKQAVLQPVGSQNLGVASDDDLRRQFLDSLVCNVDSSCQLLYLDPTKLNSRGMVRAAGGQGGSGGGRDGGMHSCHKFDEADAQGQPPLYPPEEVQRWGELGKVFVVEMARSRAGGEDVFVRSMAQCGMAGTVAYGLLGPGSHYCENLGRAHKSNHVYFVLNFVEGVCCQKCYDPDCSNFRSAWMPLPPHLCLPSLRGPAG